MNKNVWKKAMWLNKMWMNEKADLVFVAIIVRSEADQTKGGG